MYILHFSYRTFSLLIFAIFELIQLVESMEGICWRGSTSRYCSDADEARGMRRLLQGARGDYYFIYSEDVVNEKIDGKW